MKWTVWVILALLAGPVWADATGRVVDTDGAPIKGAEICEFFEGVVTQCVRADATGAYLLAKPARKTLLVRASGYVAQKILAGPLATPVVLTRAATLSVSVVDAATGQPVPSGRVMIDLPSGRRIGDSVPFNRVGVRIKTLDPGVVFVRATADGYEAGGPVPVELLSGVERSVKIPMTKSNPAAH